MLRLASLLAAASLAANKPQSVLEIRQLADDPTRIEVVTLIHEARLSLALLDDKGREGPPILGKVRQRGESTVFTPKYGLSRGLRYRGSSMTSAVLFLKILDWEVSFLKSPKLRPICGRFSQLHIFPPENVMSFFSIVLKFH